MTACSYLPAVAAASASQGLWTGKRTTNQCSWKSPRPSRAGLGLCKCLVAPFGVERERFGHSGGDGVAVGAHTCNLDLRASGSRAKKASPLETNAARLMSCSMWYSDPAHSVDRVAVAIKEHAHALLQQRPRLSLRQSGRPALPDERDGHVLPQPSRHVVGLKRCADLVHRSQHTELRNQSTGSHSVSWISQTRARSQSWYWYNTGGNASRRIPMACCDNPMANGCCRHESLGVCALLTVCPL